MLSIFGNITNPTQYPSTQGSGFFAFFSNLLKLAGVIAGLFFVVQLILAGFDYMGASGDAKKTENAWNRIWQSLVGLIIVSLAFIIAGVVGRLTGLNILNPTIYGPK